VDAYELIPLSQLAKHIPPARDGKQRHKSSVYRYALRGVRGIKLKTTQLPDGLYTTLRDWKRFVRKLTAARCGASAGTPLMPTRARTHQQNAIEHEIETVRAGLRSGKGARNG